MAGSINQQEIETKALDNSVEGLLSRSKELKNALEQFLGKIEQNHAALTWPTVLDSFALISSQVSSIMALMKSEKIAPLQNFSVIPLRLSQESDTELESLTEGRLSILNHDTFPVYLRTKPHPDVEKEERQLLTQASNFSEAQTKTFNKLCDRFLEKIEASSGFRNEQAAFKNLPRTHSPQDTALLISASTFGKGLNNFKSDATGNMMQQLNTMTSMSNVAMQGKVQIPGAGYTRP